MNNMQEFDAGLTKAEKSKRQIAYLHEFVNSNWPHITDLNIDSKLQDALNLAKLAVSEFPMLITDEVYYRFIILEQMIENNSSMLTKLTIPTLKVVAFVKQLVKDMMMNKWPALQQITLNNTTPDIIDAMLIADQSFFQFAKPVDMIYVMTTIPCLVIEQTEMTVLMFAFLEMAQKRNKNNWKLNKLILSDVTIDVSIHTLFSYLPDNCIVEWQTSNRDCLQKLLEYKLDQEKTINLPRGLVIEYREVEGPNNSRIVTKQTQVPKIPARLVRLSYIEVINLSQLNLQYRFHELTEHVKLVCDESTQGQDFDIKQADEKIELFLKLIMDTHSFRKFEISHSMSKEMEEMLLTVLLKVFRENAAEFSLTKLVGMQVCYEMLNNYRFDRCDEHFRFVSLKNITQSYVAFINELSNWILVDDEFPWVNYFMSLVHLLPDDMQQNLIKLELIQKLISHQRGEDILQYLSDYPDLANALVKVTQMAEPENNSLRDAVFQIIAAVVNQYKLKVINLISHIYFGDLAIKPYEKMKEITAEAPLLANLMIELNEANSFPAVDVALTRFIKADAKSPNQSINARHKMLHGPLMVLRTNIKNYFLPVENNWKEPLGEMKEVELDDVPKSNRMKN